MPEFILDIGSPEAARTFSRLNSFTQGYITAAFFTEEDQMREDGLEAPSFADISPETLKRMVDDCDRFMAMRSRDLDCAYEAFHRDYESSGQDFWFTRNGHGTGFWAREMGAVGDSLDQAARTFREFDFSVGDDGQIWGP